MTDDVKLPNPDFSAFNGPHYYTEPTVRRLIAKAQAEERERCALLCEARRAFALSNRHPSYAEAADDCAHAIRNRSKA